MSRKLAEAWFEAFRNRVWKEFPEDEKNHVEVSLDDDLPMVNGDLFQLSFCFKSALAYFLQFVPEDGSVRVYARRENGEVRVSINGKTPIEPVRSAGEYTDKCWLSHMLFELTVGGEAMRDFMSQHGGSLEGPKRDGDDEQFDFILPASPG